MKRKLLFAMLCIVSVLGLRAQTALSDPTAINTSTFTALSGSYTIEVEGTADSEIQIPFDRYTFFKYTPTVTGTIRFISNGSVIFVYEKESSTFVYKGMVSSFTEVSYPEMTNDNVSNAINLLGNPDFQTAGSTTIATSKYSLGNPWVISDESLYGEYAFREGVNTNAHDSSNDPNCFIWRTDDSYKDKYFYQPVAGLVANGKYKVRFRTAQNTNGNGVFSLRLGSTTGGAEYSKASITVEQGTAKVNTATLTTSSLEANSYFSVYNEADCNTSSNNSCCQIDYIMLCEANVASGVTGVSSAEYVSEVVFPYATASYEAGDYYLYNEGAEKYVVGANNWGTRASLATSGIKMTAAISDGKYTLSTAPTYTGKYLGVDGYVDQGSAQWYLIPTSEDGFIMQCASNGKFLVWDGSSATTTSMATTAPTDSKGYWTFKTTADRLAVLETATKASPQEATYLIANPDFSRNANLSLWTSTSSNSGEFKVGGGNDISNNLQQWNGYCTLYQDVTNLPSGLYKMTVQGFYRPGGSNTTSTVQNVTIYAGEEEELLMLHTNGAPSSEDASNGFTANTALGAWVPNTQGDAAKAFAAGYYVNEVDEILTTNGTIQIGAKNTTDLGYQWMVIDNFRLFYYGPTISSTAVALPAGGAMVADTWYYFDIASESTYDLTLTTLGDIVYTTDAKTLVEDQATVTTNFAKADELPLSVGRYYVKSSSNQSLVVAAHIRVYEVGAATVSVADNAYLQSVSTVTFTYASANTNDGDASLEIVDNEAVATITDNSTSSVMNGTLSASGNVLTATFDQTLTIGHTYTLTLPANVFGYVGQTLNTAINQTINTPAVADGIYFLRTPGGKYVSRGGNYNTRAIVDDFGLPMHVRTNADGTSEFIFVDNYFHLFDAGSGTVYTDNNTNPYWTIATAVGGYNIVNANDNGSNGKYLSVDGSSNVMSQNEGLVWTIEPAASHTVNVEPLKDTQAAIAATAAGISTSTKAGLAAELAANYNAENIPITGVDGIQEEYQKGAGDDFSGSGHTVYTETVSALEAGLYKLTVKGFHRMTWYGDVESAGGARSNVYVFAGDAKTQICSPFDYPSASAWVAGNDYQDASGKYYPNNQTGAGNAYDEGNYENEVYVYHTGGDLTFGILNPNRLGNDGSRGAWITYRDFTLTRYTQTAVTMKTFVDGTYGTFIAPFDVTIPSGVTASTITGHSGNTLTLTPVETTIPANTPVVVYSDDAINETFKGKDGSDGETSYTVGLLTGVYTASTVTEGNYVLQTNDGVQGFYQVGEGGLTAVPYRAYLKSDAFSAGIKAFFFDDADGINSIGNRQPTMDNAPIYNLAGQRINKTQKGLYIQNGRKLIVK